ncbi:carbohydrate kinase family protein [Bacillus salipaludis]|uniref:Carbohydrate kinase family protein n=1 Tax=Bacillus salipaludis TaxID=2547811 RepID=A0AA90QWW9_9BACI|nr:carbohydrate kinase family protein [Bacillus salipaludis]MDQ6596033.1 carbohydrate kinase family protein [Bacillus salipaludis]
MNVLCIGGANIDRKIQTINHLTFKTSNPAKSTMSCGGVARNIAENLGRLGLNSSLLGYIGDDPEGKWLRKTTGEYVDVSLLEALPGKSTGTYTAVLDEEGEMAIALADMAIYDHVEEDFIEKKWPQDRPAIVLLDTNLPAVIIELVIQHCRSENIPICIATVSVAKSEKLPRSLEGITWLVANEKEAEALSNIKIKTEGDFFKAAVEILNKGVKKVVISRGDKGLIYFTKDGEAGALVAPEVPVTDVTGAGDSLIAGIIYADLKGLNTEDSCKIGLSCSYLTIRSKETVNPELNNQNLTDSFQRYFCRGPGQKGFKSTFAFQR